MTKPEKSASEMTPWSWILATILVIVAFWLWAVLSDALLGDEPEETGIHCEVDEGYMGQKVTTCYAP